MACVIAGNVVCADVPHRTEPRGSRPDGMQVPRPCQCRKSREGTCHGVPQEPGVPPQEFQEPAVTESQACRAHRRLLELNVGSRSQGVVCGTPYTFQYKLKRQQHPKEVSKCSKSFQALGKVPVRSLNSTSDPHPPYTQGQHIP